MRYSNSGYSGLDLSPHLQFRILLQILACYINAADKASTQLF